MYSEYVTLIAMKIETDRRLSKYPNCLALSLYIALSVWDKLSSGKIRLIKRRRDLRGTMRTEQHRSVP